MPLPNPFDILRAAQAGDPAAAGLDPAGGFGNAGAPAGVAPAPAAVAAPLSPEDRESALTHLGRGALGGVGYVGGTLDKLFGGRAIRAALGLATGNQKARARDLLSIIPGSDMLGITDAGDTLHGTDLLDQYKPEDQLNFGDHAAGMALEVALDPATYLSFGGAAATKLGAQAAKAGLMPERLAARMAGHAATSPEAAKLAQLTGQSLLDVSNQPLAGLARVGIPFTDAGVTLGTGQRAQSIARGLGAAKDAAVYSKPGKAVSALFDQSLSWGGFTPTSEAVQRSARQYSKELPGVEAGVRGQFLQDANALEAAGGLGKDAGVQMRKAAEIPGSVQLPTGQQDVVQGWGNRLQSSLQADRELGLNVSGLADTQAEYFPRQRTALDTEEKAGRAYGRQFDASTPNQIKRQDPFRDIPGATETINNVFKDPAAKAAQGARDVAPQAEHIRRAHLGMTPADEANLKAFRANQPPPQVLANGQMVANPAYAEWQRLEGLTDKSIDLAHKAQGFKDVYSAGQGADFFGNHPAADMASYEQTRARARLSTKGIYDAVAGVADAAHGATPGSVALPDLLKRAGLVDHVDAAGNAIGASKQLVDRLVASGKLPAGAGADALKGLHVPGDVAGDVLRYGQAMTKPETIKPFLDIFDGVTNLTKAWQTAWAPAFHTRNGLTGLFMNFITGAKDAAVHGPLGYVKPYQDYLALRAGGEMKGAAQLPIFRGAKLTDKEASLKLSELMYQHDVLPKFGRSVATEAVGQPGSQAAAHSSGQAGTIALPGREPKKPLLDIAKGALDFSKPNSANPLAVAGVTLPEALPAAMGGGKTFTKDAFAPIAAGREFGHAVDEANRGSAFLGFLSQGFTPDIAAAKAKAAHYDYGKLTPFERSVMRRVVPFYGWMRNNLPFMVEQLATNPGGKVGQSIRGAGALRQNQGFMPDQISEGLAVPLGGQDEQGNRRYLTNLGLPFEDAFPIAGGPNGLQRTGEKLLGQTNPIIKGPLEYFTGRQFHTGRDLNDLYSRTLTGNTAIDQLVSNSPLGRPLNLASTVADYQRKGLSGIAANVLGPGRVTDVNVPRAEQSQARQYIEQALAGNPAIGNFSQMYVRPGQETALSPQDVMLMRLYRALEQQSRQQSRPPAGGLNFPMR